MCFYLSKDNTAGPARRSKQNISKQNWRYGLQQYTVTLKYRQLLVYLSAKYLVTAGPELCAKPAQPCLCKFYLKVKAVLFLICCLPCDLFYLL